MVREDSPLVVAGTPLRSRLFVGTGKYRTSEEMNCGIRGVRY